MKAAKIFDKIDAVIAQILEWALIITAAGMILLTFWQVIARYALELSVPYAEELARLMIVWCIFIGGALANRKSEHVRVEAFVNLMPKFLQNILMVLSHLLIIVFAYVLTVYGYQYVLRILPDHSTSLGYSREWFFVPNIVAGVITIFYSVVNLIRDIRGFFKKTSEEVL